MNRQSFILPSGRLARVAYPRVPLLRGYCVVYLAGSPAPEPAELDALWKIARGVAEAESLARFGERECFTLLYNAARTRRSPRPHVHVVLARSVWEKRIQLLRLALKHVLRFGMRAAA